MLGAAVNTGRRAMDAASLEDGFQVGDWLIEPGTSCARLPPHRTVELTAPQLRLLFALARRHGEAVDRHTLRHAAGDDQPLSEEGLLALIGTLRELFGDRPRQPRYIASVGTDAYALVAHFQLVPPRPAGDHTARHGVTARTQALVGELRRRHVFKMGASYLVGVWIVLQVAQVTFAPLKFPDWWMSALTILAVVGLPIVVALAWTYEITPRGIVLDSGSNGAGTVRRPRARQSIAPVIVAGVVLMAAVTGFAWWRSIRAPADAQAAIAPEPKSIAVLPLVDMSPAGGSGYLGDGLSEELATRLAQVPGLRVAARTSAFAFRGQSIDVRRIGQTLGVRHVLEGSVRRDGDRVRVTVQLIDTHSGFHLWAGNFDRAWRDVLSVQDDVAHAVTESLKVMLAQDDVHVAAAPAPGGFDARALDPYLAGLALLRRSGDLSVLDEAAQQFSDAVRVDPQFGRAYAGLCETRVTRYRRTRDPADLEAAETACQKALDVSPGLVESERALAGLYVTSGRYGTALDMYRALLDRDPRNADTHIGLGQALEGLGKLAEAETSLRRATETEPSYWSAHNALGGFLFAQGRIEEAIAEYRRVVDLVPQSASAQNNLGAALFMQGDLAGAIGTYERSLALEPSRSAYSNLGSAYYYAGRFEDAVTVYGKATEAAPNDQTLWGNLADAQWQIGARRQQARKSYVQAIRLGERDLKLGPADPMLLAQLGYYHCRIGDCTRGSQYLHDALSGGTNQMYVQYFAALIAAGRNDTAGAARAAAEALKLGYPKALLALDPVLRGRLGSPGERT
jgi:TolB-like protein/tetratricopeptide (TPR) repeat protein/DNA-binding winged helix-turn-helix (wHTH) protein